MKVISHFIDGFAHDWIAEHQWGRWQQIAMLLLVSARCAIGPAALEAVSLPLLDGRAVRSVLDKCLSRRIDCQALSHIRQQVLYRTPGVLDSVVYLGTFRPYLKEAIRLILLKVPPAAQPLWSLSLSSGDSGSNLRIARFTDSLISAGIACHLSWPIAP